jgi:hypothetical protein
VRGSAWSARITAMSLLVMARSMRLAATSARPMVTLVGVIARVDASARREGCA